MELQAVDNVIDTEEYTGRGQYQVFDISSLIHSQKGISLISYRRIN